MIWIVIPVYNRKDMTEACLRSLCRQDDPYFKIVVADDGSTDGTEAMIRQDFPDVILVKGSGDLYWSGTINLAVNRVLEEAGPEDYILTLNDDVTVEADYLTTLAQTAQKYERTLIGSVAVMSRDQQTIVDGGMRVNWLTARYDQLNIGKDYRQAAAECARHVSVDLLPGRGTLISVRIFQDIGLYNADKLPHYGADYEFSKRAVDHGYRLLVDYAAVVTLKEFATGINNVLTALSWGDLMKSFFSIRSANNLVYRWEFARLCCPWYRLPVYLPLDTARVIGGTLRNQIFPNKKLQHQN